MLSIVNVFLSAKRLLGFLCTIFLWISREDLFVFFMFNFRCKVFDVRGIKKDIEHIAM